MANFTKFNCLSEDLAKGVHNFTSDATSTLTVALCDAAHAPVATNTILANLTQIAYTNLSTRVLAISSSGQTGGLYTLKITDLTLSASGGAVAPFRYVVVYNDDAASDQLVAWYDYTQDITLGDGESLLLNFDDANGFFTLNFA